MYVSVACACLCLWRSEKVRTGHLELELQMILNHLVDSLESHLGSLHKQQVILIAESSLQPPLAIFFPIIFLMEGLLYGVLLIQREG